MTRALLLAATMLLAGCAPGTGAPATQEVQGDIVPATPAASTRPTSPSPTGPSVAPSPTAVARTTFTADDRRLASLIRAGASEAVPRLRVLSDMDPSRLALLFDPLGTWLKEQKAAVTALTASTCTTAAVELFLDGINQYDSIRKKFLAWRDWGIHGHAFTAKAPLDAADTLEDAVAELGAHCDQ